MRIFIEILAGGDKKYYLCSIIVPVQTSSLHPCTLKKGKVEAVTLSGSLACLWGIN